MNAVPESAGGRRRARAPRSGGRTAEPTNSSTRRRDRDGAAVDGATALNTAPRESTRRRIAPWLTVAPPTPVRGPRAPFVALLLLVVVGGVLGILMVNTKIMENAFQLENLQQQRAALDIREAELQQRVNYFESPNNLDAAARQLGLKQGEPAFIRLPDGRIIEFPAPPTAPQVAAGGGTGTGGVDREGGVTSSNERQAGR
ncbi:hypothetical protein [Pilimelia columellifera]|uniref:Cell division protein FtsL n=1 Tax=Pilimelia columellifera subsp. columellifera TaxID=706583 RepID=A0ABN3NA98_9ACTN